MINRRLFGADIDTRVKKILEARQNAASQTRDPNEEIKPSDYPDKRTEYYKYNELHTNQFQGEGVASRQDLSGDYCQSSPIHSFTSVDV